MTASTPIARFTGSALLPCILAIGCQSQRPVPVESQPSIEIPVFTKNPGTAPGLFVRRPTILHAAGPDAGRFDFEVANHHKEEIFLEVTGYDSLGHTLQDEGGFAGAGGGEVFFADNTRLLKRLHAASLYKGKWACCGCAVAYINGRICNSDIDLTKRIGKKGTISIPLRGCFRNGGREFYGCRDVPVEIVKCSRG